MKSEPSNINRQSLAREIRGRYGLDLSSLEFQPVGEDSYGYIATCGDGSQYFLKLHAPHPFLVDALHATRLLHDRHGLQWVVAPRPALEGELLSDYQGLVLALFNMVPGETAFDVPLSDEDWATAAYQIADLHNLPLPTKLPARDALEIEFESTLKDLLRVAPQLQPENDIQEEARRLLLSEHTEILRSLAHLKELQNACRAVMSPRVITHGDPNLANILRDGRGGLKVIDWGGIAPGPAELDLAFFTGERFPLFLAHYLARRPGIRLHKEFFVFHTCHWRLQEITDYGSRILLQHVDPIEAAHSLTELRCYLPLRHNTPMTGSTPDSGE